MKEKHTRIEIAGDQKEQRLNSPLDLWRLKGGESRHVREKDKKAPDAMLAVLGDRVTYTFIMDNEVASIHFDRLRREVFFKGHNLANMEITDAQRASLMHMGEVLASDEKAKKLVSDYEATLARLLTDNDNRGK